MTDVEMLLAIEQIKQLKARYFRVIDTKKFEELAEIFTEDAVFDAKESTWDPVLGQYPGFKEGEVWKTRSGIVENVKLAMPDSLQSCHMGHLCEITITSPTTATGIIPFNDRLIIPNVLVSNGYGYYHETYEKVDGKWMIASSRIQRLRVVFGE